MIEEILNRYPKQSDYLIEILLDVQNTKDEQYLSEKEIEMIAEYLSLPTARVSSAVSFYTFFSTQPRGKFILQVCEDVPCYVNSSDSIVTTINKALDIEMGQTTEDGIFTLEHTSCLGACDGAPALRVDNKIYKNLNENKVMALLSELRGRS